VKKTLIYAMALAALVGCGGGGASRPNYPAIPMNRVVVVVAEGAEQDGLFSITSTGNEATRHATITGDLTVLDVDNSGRRLLVARLDDDGTEDLFETSLDGTTDVRQLTDEGFGEIDTAQYSEDGGEIVVAGIGQGDVSLVITMDVNGGDQVRVEGVATQAGFLADGRLGILGAPEDETGDDFVGVMNRDGSDVQSLVPNVIEGSIDVRGDRIVFSTVEGGDAGGGARVYALDVDGGGPVAVTAGDAVDQFPVFSPDLLSVYVNRQGLGIFSVPASGGTPTSILDDPDALYVVATR